MAEREREAARSVFDRDEVEGVLSGSFYSAPEPSGPHLARGRAKRVDKPAHYKVICISMYTKDLDRLDAVVQELKSQGMTKASRSALIRHALGSVDLDKVPRGI